MSLLNFKLLVVKRAYQIIIAIILMVGCMTPAVAQRRTVTYLPKYESEPYHFGFILGMNTMYYDIHTIDNFQQVAFSPTVISCDNHINFVEANQSYHPDSVSVYSIEPLKHRGFTVGIVVDKRLGRFFNLRVIPTYCLNSKKVDYEIAGYCTMDDGTTTVITCPANSHNRNANFVELPIQIKYHSLRYNNIGAYIIGGVNPKLDLSSRKKLVDNDGLPKLLVTEKFDLALEIGTGFDFFNQWFKMGVELKMSFGMLNVLKPDDYYYTAAINRLKNRQFQICFTFE